MFEAIGVLAAGGLQDRVNSVAPDGMTEALARLDVRIRAEFPHALAVSAFAQLGAPHLDTGRTPRLQPRVNFPGGPPQPAVDCTCSQRQNFCDSVTNPTPYCAAKNCRSLPSGCGWFWMAACDGLCSTTP